MKKSLIGALLLILALHASAQVEKVKKFVPYISLEKAALRADSICKLMSLDEKVKLIGGYKIFYLHPFPQYNIPVINLADATQGVRIRNLKDTLMKMTKSTAFPNPLQLAATWNPMLSYTYANAVGEECRSGGVDILLGPGINIYRNAQNGRNFEYFGEDPYLISRMVEQYVVGIQNTGTMATIKHFLANNTDLDRRKSNSIVDERALHEIYMPGFKAGIDAGVMSVMTAYNLLNGEWTGQSDYVINQLLRKDLGFTELVMSDWTSVYDAQKIINSGLDLEMPAAEKLWEAKKLVESGKVKIEQVDRMVKNILRACIAMGFYDKPNRRLPAEANFGEHEKVALQTAREGIVLLKNRKNILPLTSMKDILLAGKYVDTNAIGQGAALVTGYNIVNMSTALKNEFGNRLTVIKKPSDDEIKKASCIILSVGTLDGESFDRPFDLPIAEDEYINKVCSLNKNTIVVVNTGSGINMSSWSEKAAAILYAWYPGQIGQVALAEILAGKTNPSGKLPMTIEKKFEDSPAFGYNPPEKPVMWPRSKNTPKHGDPTLNYDINYKEGIFVGYRWYNHKKIEPLYHFGEGLSYTTFGYSKLKIDQSNFKSNGTVEVSFILSNTGKVDGAEIVQLYVTDQVSSVERPIKELKGFKKIFLKRGESTSVTITLTKHDFEFWHPTNKTWTFEAGKFTLNIGRSSAKSNLKQDVNL